MWKAGTTLAALAVASVGAVTPLTALGQVDLNGDGRIEVAFAEPSEGQQAKGFFSVLDGSTGMEIWRRSGPPLSGFGWAATAHPDIDGDGLADVIVTAVGTGGAVSGSVYAFRGLDGQLLWSRPFGQAGAGFGLGVGVVPDQDGDGVSDLIVAMLSNDAPGEVGVLVSGRSGAVWAAAVGRVADLLQSTRLGTRFPRADVDGSGQVDWADLTSVANQIGTNSPSADINVDGVVDDGDVVMLIDEIMIPLDPNPTLSPLDFRLFSLIDPILYNDGHVLIPLEYLARGGRGPGRPPAGGPNPPPSPCADLHQQVLDAGIEWVRHATRFIKAYFDHETWKRELKRLRDRYNDLKNRLNDCLAREGYNPFDPKNPNIFTPTTPLNPPPLPGTTPPPIGPGGAPCPLGNSFPPPPQPPGSPTPPCAAQLESNTLSCQACQKFNTSNEPFDACMQRAKEIFDECRRQSAPASKR